MSAEETIFQRRLKRTRRRRGLTQEQVAEKAKAHGGPSLRQYAEWERGLTKRPHPKTLKAVADVLDVDPLWLEGDEEDDDDGIPARNS